MRVATDENFDGRVLGGLLALVPTLDVLRVQDMGLAGADDTVILEWAASERRVLLTHDVRTLTAAAYDRVRAGLPMWGVVEVQRNIATGQAIDELWILVECSLDGEWKDLIVYIPM